MGRYKLRIAHQGELSPQFLETPSPQLCRERPDQSFITYFILVILVILAMLVILVMAMIPVMSRDDDDDDDGSSGSYFVLTAG